jgi:hypothetical protein
VEAKLAAAFISGGHFLRARHAKGLRDTPHSLDLPVVLYEYDETWRLIFREVHALRMSENTVLRIMVGFRRRMGEICNSCE